MKQNSSFRENSSFLLMPEIDEYKGIHEPILTVKKKQAIEQKLKIEKQASKKAKERQKNLDPYIKYDYNPLKVHKFKDIAPLLRVEDEDKDKELINLVDKMVEISQNRDKMVVKQKINSQIKNMNRYRLENEKFSQKILEKISDQINKKQAFPQKQVSVSFKEKQANALDLDQFSTRPIQLIAAQKQPNFFMNKQKFNVFSAIENDSQPSPYQKLKQFHFTFNSMCEKLTKIKIPVYRDLSRMGRSVMMGKSTGNQNIIDYIDSLQLSFKVQYLGYQDLMSVASNRFSHQFLSRMINENDIVSKKPKNEDISETSSQQNDQTQQVFYRDSEKNKIINFIDDNQEIQEIEDYKKLELQTNEQLYKNRCQNKQKKIIQDLNLQQHLYRNTITDKIIHVDIKDNVKKGIEAFSDNRNSKIEIDRLVRANKQNKNKNQGIKIKTLISTLAQKNKHDELVNKTGKNKF